jgi:predicted negative regulator of RcsB-dependent stress response
MARSCEEKRVAKIKEQPKELPKDAFQTKGEELAGKLETQLNNQGRNILIALGAIAALLVLFGLWQWNSRRQTQKAEFALGQAYKIENAQVTASPAPDSTEKTFPTEKERAQKAGEAFQAVNGYGAPTDNIARYQAAVDKLAVDRPQGLSQLQQLVGDSNPAVAVLAKFALAQAHEADAKYDEAAKLYGELAAANNDIITPDTANLRLAHVYEKQGKKAEAVNILFNIVKAARERKDKDGKPLDQSAAAREASQQLEKLDPKRFGELPKEPEANA